MSTMEILSCWLSAFIVLGLIFLIGWMIADGIAFTRAINKVRKGYVSYAEWSAEPNRLMPGSGFRLWAKFKNR